MKIVTIEQTDHSVLRTPAKTVTFPLSEENKQLIEGMKDFLTTKERGVGLAAPQVGHSLQIICIQIPEELQKIRQEVFDSIPLTTLINPTYQPILKEDKRKGWEACFSVPDIMAEIYRHHAIHYEWDDMEGKKHRSIAKGFLARLLQHEIGHLNGEIYTDLLEPDCRIGGLEEMRAIALKEMNASVKEKTT